MNFSVFKREISFLFIATVETSGDFSAAMQANELKCVLQWNLMNNVTTRQLQCSVIL